MGGAAEVRSGNVAPAHDELAALEPLAFARVEAWHVRAAVRRQEQTAGWAKHASQLVAPRQLKLIGEGCENRQRVDEVEAFVLEPERRPHPAALASREPPML